MHTTTIDLKTVKHYASVESCQKSVEKALEKYISAGLVFNIMVVSQRKGGMGTDAEDLRYVPLLHCFRVDEKNGKFLPPILTMCAQIARMGFTCFA